MLTPEQTALFTKLESGSYSFTDLSTDERAVISATLRPVKYRPFTEEQRQLLTDWYLLVTVEQLEYIKTILSPGLGLNPRITTDGRITLDADLLTDCVRPGDTWYSIVSVLTTYPLIKLSASDFPIIEDEL
jgi:hypothetical protein